MKKTILPILTLVVYLFGSISVTAEDHKHKLHEIGERIKQAVKAGKITEKEGWAKWHAVLREHGHDEDDDYHDEDESEEAEELEREIEIRELEFELERLELEHEMQRMEWDHERERMQRDFDRERREWEIEELDHSIFLDKHRKQLEMQMRGGPRPGGFPPHGARPPHVMNSPHPHHGSGPKPDMRRGGPPKGIFPPMGKRPGMHFGKKPGRPDFHRKSFDHKRGPGPDSRGKPECGKSDGKPDCGKGKSGCDKKESCKTGDCKKSESCPKKDSSCKKGEKSCPDKKEDCSKKKAKK